MVIDIALYDATKAVVQGLFKPETEDLGRHIAMTSNAFMVPCIVVAYWIGEITNWHPDTVSTIVRLRDFYGYTEILNKPKGAPV